MPIPSRVFDNAQEIIAHVRQSKALLDQQWALNVRYTKEKVIEKAVDVNTYRGIEGYTDVGGPKKLFTRWAEKVLDTEVAMIASLSNQPDYDKWLEAFAEDLRRTWPKRTSDGKKLAYGQSRKLTNLLMKTCVFWNRFDDPESRQLIKLLHVPLDEYVLKGFKKVLASPLYNKIDVGYQPSMSTVTDPEMYATIQKAIRDVAAQAKLPVIYFDLYTLAH
jgi:hypothetical protein